MSDLKDDKPFTVLNTDRIRVTDLKDGTSEVVLKESMTVMIVPNNELYQMLLASRPKRRVESYRHGH